MRRSAPPGSPHPPDARGLPIPDGSWPPGKEAPGRLETLRRFVNTVNPENGAELLATGEEMAAWLDGEDLPAVEVDDAGLARLHELRWALRDLAAAHHDGTEDPEAWKRFHRSVGDAALRVVPESGGPRLAPVGSGADAIAADLAGIVLVAIANGSWGRLKACSNLHCRWVFWDRSRSATGTWCSMGACGQRAKQRAYRRRHSPGAGQPAPASTE